MRIATFNVNSIKVREQAVAKWLEETKPDVAVLQEIKCVDENFPAATYEAMGYTVAVHGQKTYNGVAMLSAHGLEDVRCGLPHLGPEDEEDDHARYIEALIPISGKKVRVGGLYLPNGNPAPGPKYDYKLRWMERLHAHAQSLLAQEEPFALCGDYNVIPTPNDLWDEKAWEGDALYRPETHQAFRAFCNLGLTDAWRACHSEPHQYSFWDYQRGAWNKDHGIRIDHLMLSPQASDLLTGAGIDRYVRGREKPSDHTPVWCELEV